VEATVDVAAWLKNLGLGQYEAAFRDNAIEGDLLPTLTAEDLKDLGVTRESEIFTVAQSPSFSTVSANCGRSHRDR
jgi:hypothetical protein